MAGSTHQYLSSEELTMIERILARADLQRSSPELQDAARSLTQTFQDGIVDAVGLARELDRHISTRHKWRAAGGG